MQIPLELTVRNLERTSALEAMVEEKVERLERYCDDIIGCRIAIERPHEHATSGNPYRVRLDITVPPRHEIVAVEDPRDNELNDELETVVNRAFLAAERQLKEVVERRRGEVKTHEEPRALVVRKFPEQDYGFLKTPEGREIYFHRNAVLEGDFDRLAVGTEVRFEETMGAMGPQATTVQVVNKPGERVGKGEDGVEPPAGWQS